MLIGMGGGSLRLIVFVVLAVVSCIQGQYAKNHSNKKDKLRTVFEWKDLEYSFPSEAEKQQALNQQLYIPHNGVPVDVDAQYRADGSTRIFVTIPRFSPGTPFSVATVSSRFGPNGPLLEAYPNYNMHRSHGADCKGITSVFRVAIDECNRIWMVDTGRIGTTQHCPPQILVFNIDNDILLFRYKIPSGQYFVGMSLFITPIVDIPNRQCNQAKLYVADVQAPGLLVFDSATHTSWRIQHKWMYPDPDFGTFTIARESFNLMDGMFGMSLTPHNYNGERHLYFHPLASERESSVPLRAINNVSMWIDDPEAHPEFFRALGQRGVQCAAEAMDSHGNLYCCLMEPISIFSWNINTPYQQKFFNNIITNPEKLQFASGMKIIKNRQGQEELWVFTNRFQKISAGTIDYNQINFRILAGYISDLVGEHSSGGHVRPGLPVGRPGGPGNTNINVFKDLQNNLIFT